MNDTARRLRAQKAYSTDPAYLERMAREEETRRVDPTNDVAAEGGKRLGELPDSADEPIQLEAAEGDSRSSRGLTGNPGGSQG